jgi:hypothetical protein
VTNGILERNWETNGRSKVAQIVIPRSRVKDVLTEVNVGPVGGHLGVNKTLNKFRQRFYWLQARADIEKWLPTVRHVFSQSRTADQESLANALV